MMLNDTDIKLLSSKNIDPMIDPFLAYQVKESVISYGLSSYGYDVRISKEFLLPIEEKRVEPCYIDPKGNSEGIKWNKVEVLDHIIIPSGTMILGKSVEYIRVPRNISVICLGKSTYARCGLIVNVTPLEPEWQGFITMEISNTSSCNVKLYANEGIAQLLFLKAEKECRVSYADKKGKYQAQKDIVTAHV